MWCVEDIFIACTDNLTGFSAAIEGFNHQLRKVIKAKSVFRSWQPVENAVSGHDGHYQEMGGQAPGLEHDAMQEDLRLE